MKIPVSIKKERSQNYSEQKLVNKITVKTKMLTEKTVSNEKMLTEKQLIRKC